VFPGGFGTLDELFETLCLIQTGKARPMPVLLFDRAYWQRIVSFDALVEEGVVDARDLGLFSFVETAQEAWMRIESHYAAVA
jgi:predicted Rossmann-fold nucleotide-binding protein